jgi:hypothetical protein
MLIFWTNTIQLRIYHVLIIQQGNTLEEKNRLHIWCTPNSLKESNVSLKLKTMEEQGVVPSSQHYRGVEGRVEAPGWD